MRTSLEELRLVATKPKPLNVPFASARLVTPAIFIATKLSAFNDRGKGDYLLSRDLEDIITVVDGRADIIEDVKTAPPHVREFIVAELAGIIKHPDFQDALPGHMPGIQGAQQRVPLVRKRFESLVSL